MIVLVDTNVLVRTLRPGDPQFSMAVEGLASLRASGHQPAVVPQVLYELWAVATRPKANNGLGFGIEQATQDQENLLATFDFLDEDRGVFEIWRALIASHGVAGKQSHDCHLVAAMIRHGISHLLTFNAQDFARFDEIIVIPPDQAAELPSATS